MHRKAVKHYPWIDSLRWEGGQSRRPDPAPGSSHRPTFRNNDSTTCELTQPS